MQALFSVRRGCLPKVGFEKIASNVGESRVHMAPKTARLGGFQGLGDFQMNFGYLVTWLNISELFNITSYQGGDQSIRCRTCQIPGNGPRPDQIQVLEKTGMNLF